MHIYRPVTPFVEKILGSWSVHENFDLFGDFNTMVIKNWEEKYTLQELKWICMEGGYCGFSSQKNSGMAVLKYITWPIKEELFKPIEDEIQNSLTFYRFTPDATYK